jgi:adenylate kinase family enzyme
MIIQIMGLPGAGKTALAQALLERVDAIHLNADGVRSTVNSDLGFSLQDRIENARRLGEIARLVSKQNKTVIVDFVCPTVETRNAFGSADFVIWVDRIPKSRFADTNALWQNPEIYDLQIKAGQTIEEEVNLVIKEAKLFDWSAPTTLQLGRYQPWHEGHQALKQEAHSRTEQVLLGVRNTYKTSEKDPLTFEQVQGFILQEPTNAEGTLILRLPNITNIVYGRDVGYKIEHVELSKEIQAVSATQKRKEMGL